MSEFDHNRIIFLMSLCLVFQANIHGGNALQGEYWNPYFHFPYGGPYMGILTAFAIPLKVNTPGDVFLSVNFEASYSLPQNQTSFMFPPVIGQTARQLLYNLFEQKLKSNGYPGRPCLLRTICEAADLSTAGTGILGDIVHLILTPSSSLNTNLTQEYQEAEGQAKKKHGCKKYKKSCKFSLLKVFTWVEKVFAGSGIPNGKLLNGKR
ncbi:uncharacterized protein [Euwallacea fornicatus]|uniref:uncharacterized protein n=1 Tax=Euwallacea fornicatus TaxID=995702 RepID=UPI00338F4308